MWWQNKQNILEKFYVTLANIFSNGEIPEQEIVAEKKEDADRLLAYMING